MDLSHGSTAFLGLLGPGIPPSRILCNMDRRGIQVPLIKFFFGCICATRFPLKWKKKKKKKLFSARCFPLPLHWCGEGSYFPQKLRCEHVESSLITIQGRNILALNAVRHVLMKLIFLASRFSKAPLLLVWFFHFCKRANL